MRTSASGNMTRLAEIGLVVIAGVWGLTFVMVKDAVAILHPMAFLAYRFIAASLLAAVLYRRELLALGMSGVRAGLAMGTWLTSGYVLQTVGLTMTSASNAGFIVGLFVVLTPVLGALFFGQRTTRAVWLAVTASVVGLYLLSGSSGHFGSGDLLELLAAAAFAFHILATDRGVKEHHPGALLAVQLGVCGFFCLAVAAPAGHLMLPRGATVWSALIVTSLFGSVAGYWLQSYAQRHAPPARTALILTCEPAFAGLFAYLIKGERLSGLGWCGAGLILTAIVGLELSRFLNRAEVSRVSSQIPTAAA